MRGGVDEAADIGITIDYGEAEVVVALVMVLGFVVRVVRVVDELLVVLRVEIEVILRRCARDGRVQAAVIVVELYLDSIQEDCSV